jgi:membrane protease YdiL (CAAX protease family)
LTGSGVLRSSVLAFEPLELTAALVGGLAILAFFLRGQPQAQRWRAPVLVVALFGPSLAEVLVFAGIVFTAAEYVLAPGTGPLIAAMGAALASSAAFALYHLTHGAPWNQWRMIRTLFAVWLLVAGTYAWTTNLWAAVIVNTCMATIGFIKGRVTRAEEQPLLVSVGLDLVAVVALMVIVSTAA